MRLLKSVLGILLIPVAIGTGRAFLETIYGIGVLSTTLRLLERGVLVYLIFHVMIIRPVYLYVLGHETVHALANWICGGRLISFNVSPSGGNVVTSKSNVFIELSPYFVPIYTLLLGLMYVILTLIDKQLPHMTAVFVFMIGITLAFHFAMTSEVLRMEQPDIIKSGFIFSFILIFLANLIIVIAVFTPIFDSISFIDFIKTSYDQSKDIYVVVYDRIAGFIDRIKDILP